MLKAITAEFVIKVDGIRVEVTKGRVPEYFLHEIKLVQRTSQAVTGKIYGMKRGRQVTLECSKSIPENVLQRLRNVWKPNPTPSNDGNLKRR
ncbi:MULTISPECIES: DUF3634 family protein [unclassified Agarivorans]|uniref:DUF3634 family protein n=1 Tax=unclassified Agarivorans TaxID=2636026 RepID=UPI0010D417B7|nr:MULTISPECIES: DUF3634 family protein [unclassified Agarivorans]MDO6683942.1 DUF3634 family protein [Agarivorans sp. 3_MG-2023]MDO6714325.1 DUF3634 family protein [Agarivorans sp. 2_MG-2023]MDO6762443.1 DUF3634 family protein [Agarivorans sp. 1_MG-2023]GDY25021.1 hypothetical protein AHAT_09110 [Agarivorans sp. Toyoura001]